jgi:hypothetical protein
MLTCELVILPFFLFCRVSFYFSGGKPSDRAGKRHDRP